MNYWRKHRPSIGPDFTEDGLSYSKNMLIPICQDSVSRSDRDAYFEIVDRRTVRRGIVEAMLCGTSLVRSKSEGSFSQSRLLTSVIPCIRRTQSHGKFIFSKIFKHKNSGVYMGDHMTRIWNKDARTNSESVVLGSSPKHDTTSERERAQTAGSKQSSFKRTLPDSAPCSAYTPNRSKSVSFRNKQANGKRKIKSGKEILMQFDITKVDLDEWQHSFDALLKSSAGRYVFRMFLESEIADENLKFWLACEELKRSTKNKRIDKRIQYIYDTYINVYSPHEVNIDYKMRENIVDQLKYKMDVSVFTEAQHQIYTLMHRDSYPRFLSSAITAEVTQEVLDRERNKNANKKSDSIKSSDFIVCCCRRQNSVRETLGVVEEQPTISTTGVVPMEDIQRNPRDCRSLSSASSASSVNEENSNDLNQNTAVNKTTELSDSPQVTVAKVTVET